MKMRKNAAPRDAPTAIPTVEPFPPGPEEFWGDPVTVGRLEVGLDLALNELDNIRLGFGGWVREEPRDEGE